MPEQDKPSESAEAQGSPEQPPKSTPPEEPSQAPPHGGMPARDEESHQEKRARGFRSSRRGRRGRGGGHGNSGHGHGHHQAHAQSHHAHAQPLSQPQPSPAAPRRGAKPAKREILAATNFEETRVALLEDGRLAELFWERKSEESIVGNIYKGTVENVLPGISSAFVNIGYEKNAYLYISDVIGERNAPIDARLKRGRHIMVQVAKEAIGTKGMKVSMDIALPGKYLILTPFSDFVGVSRSIEDPAQRERLGVMAQSLASKDLGGRGLIIRTEAEGAAPEELERELQYLLSLWKTIEEKFESNQAPALLYKDLDLAVQIARDVLSDDILVYMLDDRASHQNVLDFLDRTSPELKSRVRLYEGKTPIFKAYRIEEEIEKLRQIKVELESGGSIIIQEAESLCAIDVNTGRFTGSRSQEETVTLTNVEAAQEIAHQLRLRNIGGIIVVDFIDMKKAANRNKVMEAFAQALKNDRAKVRILPITRLGLIELTRERKRESTVSFMTEECPQCKGSGRVLSGETLRIRIQREIMEMTGGRPGGQVRLQLHPGLAEQFRAKLGAIEKNVHRSVKVEAAPQLLWEDYRIVLE